MEKLRSLSAILAGLVLVSIEAHAETFSTWQAAHFSAEQLSEPWISGQYADPDADGVRNFLEYAYASDPWVNQSDTGPVSSSVTVEDGAHLTLTYRRLKAAGDLFMLMQASSDLQSWSFPENVTATTDSSHANYDLTTLRDPLVSSSTDRRFLRLVVAMDSDQDGLPDDWEMLYFGNLNSSGTDDNDLDLLNNLAEYLRGSDPTDFYNGETPVLVPNGGNTQTGFAGAVLPVALSVKVYHAGGTIPWPNAPVIFSTTAGGYFSSGTSPATVRSDADGLVNISYNLSETPGGLTITATAGKASNTSTVTFTETVSALPPNMGPITALGNGTDVQISWTPTPGASSYNVQRFTGNTWQSIGTAAGDTTSLTDPNQPADDIEVYKVIASDGSALQSPSEIQGGIANPDANNDGDGMTNQDEVQAGFFSQTLADEPPATTTTLKYGGNPHGWQGPDPKLPDTDGDGVTDDLDGWANNPAIHPPRLPEAHYAVIPLEPLRFPHGYQVLEINDKMQILAFSYPDPDESGYVDTNTVKDVILWDMADQSTTRVPVLSPDVSGGYHAPYTASALQSHHFLNNNGMVCGMIYNAQTGYWEAATWTKAGGTVLLPHYNSPFLSGTIHQQEIDYVAGLNDAGEVVGMEYTQGDTPAAEGTGEYIAKDEGGGVKWKAGASAVALGDHYTISRPIKGHPSP